MLKSLIAAFSMYSRIPMPQIEWNEKTAGYSLCFFPAVGAVLGACGLVVYHGALALGLGKELTASLLCALPILLTGGIHMDGFLDTMDARNSFRPKEEKLRILKDPHIGSFAAIWGALYLLLSFGALTEVGTKGMGCLAVGYVYSRILSGLSVVTLRKAKKEGMAASAAEVSQNGVKYFLAAELVLCVLGLCWGWRLMGLAVALAGGVGFLHYRHMAYQVFDGITGDLAGYFLQICELLILLAVVLGQKL